MLIQIPFDRFYRAMQGAKVVYDDAVCWCHRTCDKRIHHLTFKVLQKLVNLNFPYSSICDILTLLKKYLNSILVSLKFFCTFVLIRIGLIGWSQTFFYWKRKSPGITNLKTKLQQRHTSLTCTFLSSFLLLLDDSPFLLCLPSIFGWLLLGAFSTGLACITIFISYFNSFLFASLTFGASSTITLLWSTSWASLTSPIAVIIYNFRFSVTLGKTKTN